MSLLELVGLFSIYLGMGALYLAGIEMPTDRRRGVHAAKHPKITWSARRRARG